MKKNNTRVTPDWLNRTEYPFPCKTFKVEAGRLNYVDEGEGEPIVFVHGNPDWSFSYRNLIKHFSNKNRCIAIDHIGFGLSDKPCDWTYLPEDHATNLSLLLEELDLSNITLVVNDWGGPIGLSYAILNPDRIKKIVLFNTWCWPTNDDWYYQLFSKFMGGPIGRLLVRRNNFFVNGVVKMAYGDKSKLTEEIQRHYAKPFEIPAERKGSWIFPKEIITSGKWLGQLWSKIDLIKDKPVLILWGNKDIAFRDKELKKWMRTLTDFKLQVFENAGHYPHEEQPAKVVELISEFLS